jgi:hypothetical protein
VLVLLACLDAAVVAFGTDLNGSKAFVATAADQQSLMAFAFNAMIGTSLFGAIAVARQYGHKTTRINALCSTLRHRQVDEGGIRHWLPHRAAPPGGHAP